MEGLVGFYERGVLIPFGVHVGPTSFKLLFR